MSRPNTDQLALALDAVPPSAPLALRPMLSRAAGSLPRDGRHLFDVSWGGLRVLVHLRDGSARVIAHGRDVATAFPELTEALAGVAAPGTVLDGEIVVPDAAGRLDRVALRDRLRGGRPAGAMAAFVISDLPWLDGAGLLAEPLRTRRVRLAALALDRPHLVVLPPATDEGARVLAAAVARGLAAVVAKRLDSPYLPGVTSRLWRSVRIEAQGRSSVDRPDVEVLGDTRLALLQPLPLGGRG